MGKGKAVNLGFLTGRLARLVAPNQLADATQNNTLAHFPIGPGRQTQVLQFGDNQSMPEHFYIHVSGTQKNASPQFGTSDHTEGLLQHRPGLLTPFLTPHYQESQHWQSLSAWHVLQNEPAPEEGSSPQANRPAPSYVWHYRPEYQFSRFSLDIDALVRQGAGQGDNTTEEDLWTDNPEHPTLRSDDAWVDLYYSLIGSEFERLDPLDSHQHLVFSLGGQELSATLGPNQQLRFENLTHLDALASADFLNLRLAVNHDAGNVLWEWAFNRNGLHVYYHVPGNTEARGGAQQNDIEIFTLNDAAEEANANHAFYTLGGKRLRYRYIAPAQATHITRTEWRFSHDGRYCHDYGVETVVNGQDCAVVAANVAHVPEGEQTGDVYWEPTAGTEADSPALWATNLTITAQLTGTWETRNEQGERLRGGEYSTPFIVRTRELGPPEEGQPAMEGPDVQMLENMLWAFGISPQWGFPGMQGTRIDSIAAVEGLCDHADEKHIFSIGWENRRTAIGASAGETRCLRREASIEAMVRRFTARNVDGEFHLVRGADLNNADNGHVNNAFLNWLFRDWVAYTQAVDQFNGHEQISIAGNQELFTEWVNEAVQIWEYGLEGHTDRVPANVYTEGEEGIHDGILATAGLASNENTNRTALLRHWVEEEATFHWGRGDPVTSFRMYEGGADEHGSMSFSQLLYRMRYSNWPCTAHGEANLNLFAPNNQIIAFVMHTASNTTQAADMASCEGGFHKAFVSRRYQRTFANDTVAFNGQPANVNELVGHRHANGDIVPVAAHEDHYDLLGKAMAGYNGADGWLRNHSFAKLIKYGTYVANSDRNTGTTCHSCRYAIQAKSPTFGEHLRTYIWAGERHPAGHANAGQPAWCFAYGEQEWMAGVTFTATQTAAIGSRTIAAQGRINCTTGEPINDQ